MASATLSERPPENQQAALDEWVEAVERLIVDAETWCRELDWGTKRSPKTMVEDRERLGTYTVPRLLILGTKGRLLLDPIARYVVGADGLVDLQGLCYRDPVFLVWDAEGWNFYLENDSEGPKAPWSKAAFLQAADILDAPE